MSFKILFADTLLTMLTSPIEAPTNPKYPKIICFLCLEGKLVSKSETTKPTEQKRRRGKGYWCNYCCCQLRKSSLLFIIERKKKRRQSKMNLRSRLLSLGLMQCLADVSSYSPLWSDNHIAKAVTKSTTTTTTTTKVPSSTKEVTRRELFFATAATASMVAVNPLGAIAADSLIDYKDETLGFNLKVPSDWETSVQSLPDRRKIQLYIKPNSNQKTLLFFAYTPVRDDFTSLGSFGSVDEVGQATILPKSTLAGVESESSMLSAESKKQAYFFDYVTKVPSQPKTHFKTIFSLLPKTGSGAAGNVLLTITAQTPEDEYESLKPFFDDIIESYKPK